MGGRKYADSEGVRGRLGSTPALDSSLDLGLEQGRVEVGAEARAAVEHCAQSVRCLPGKHEDWRSIPRTAELEGYGWRDCSVVRAHNALAGNLSWLPAPSSHIRQLTTACDSSSRGSDTSGLFKAQ